MVDTLRALIFREGDTWVAQGLERDICAQADSLDEVVSRFAITVELEEKEGGGSLDHLPEAPRQFFERSERSGQYVPGDDGGPAGQVRFKLAA